MKKPKLKEISIHCYYEGNTSLRQIKKIITDALRTIEGLEPRKINITETVVEVENRGVVQAQVVHVKNRKR